MFFCVPRTKRTNRVLPQAAQTKQSTTSAETKTREQVHTDNSHPYYHAPADGSHPTSMTPTMTPYLICLQGVTHAYYHGTLARYYHGDITATRRQRPPQQSSPTTTTPLQRNVSDAPTLRPYDDDDVP